MNPLKRRVTVGLFAVALVAAACGGGSGTASGGNQSKAPARGFNSAPIKNPPTYTVDCPDQDLQPYLDQAHPGTIIGVRGVCTGPFTIHTNNLTLQGVAFNIPATLYGGGKGSVVTIPGGVTTTLTGLTIEHGGTGIENDDGTVTINDSQVSNNIGGSGIRNPYGASMTLNNSRVVDNNVNGGGPNGGGGGILNGGTLTLNQSLVSHNTQTGAEGYGVGGGGINNTGSENIRGVITLKASQVTDNTSSGEGGGILNNIGTVNLVGSTVSGNTENFQCCHSGGGINNSTPPDRGGVSLQDKSVVKNNNPDNCGGPFGVPGCSG